MGSGFLGLVSNALTAIQHDDSTPSNPLNPKDLPTRFRG